eukprot:TRINITY_DN1616_c1_g1_i2.p1 TRINITY_DN1616_c1_g1~~TRINITY_DN1616_c1_g1_i2.p1  ORF type:complete len:288 (+),score=34.06 TRINITY_DN1616_c1_g1_i2:171-1034(+)
MARPPNSSAVYRSVQDWKPSVHKVAHANGERLEYNESTSMMHFILIDRMGFRWPVRFTLVPGMTLWDVINLVDAKWFGVVPTFPRAGAYHTCSVLNRRDLFSDYTRPCIYGHPSHFRCNSCAVIVPYEYLDAMAPPSEKEAGWMREKSRDWVRLPSNARVACQVYVEDWMDGMTVAVPQTESLVYQMYYNQGADKDSVDSKQADSLSRVKNWDDGYMFPLRTPRGDKPPLHFEQVQYETESYLDENELGRANASTVSITECFWKDNVDDIIRIRYPDWKGAYEYANK